MGPPLRVSVQFLTREQGGRAAPPGHVYATVAEFAAGPAGIWSVALEFESPPDVNGRTLAEMRLLAPQILPPPGTRFALLEGKQRVAEGLLLPLMTTWFISSAGSNIGTSSQHVVSRPLVDHLQPPHAVVS